MREFYEIVAILYLTTQLSYVEYFLEEKKSKELDQESMQYRKSAVRQIDGGKKKEIKFKNENTHENRWQERIYRYGSSSGKTIFRMLSKLDQQSENVK